MAAITLITGTHMYRSLTTGNRAVVATNTIAHKRRMIRDGCWYPRSRAVAGIALLRSLNMGRGFTTGNDTVVATATCTDHMNMVHC